MTEGQYEWGNPEKKFVTNSQATEFKLAAAARKWRIHKGEAFKAFKFLIHVPESKAGPYKRLIEAGKGEVVTCPSPYTTATGVTHLLTDTKFASNKQIDYEALARMGVPVLKPVYLSEFLISDSGLELDQLMIEEFKAYWRSRNVVK